MALAIITKPVNPVLTPAEFRAHARLGDDTTEDTSISGMIAAVTSWLAGPQGWLGRSLVTQTLALTVPLAVSDGFTGPVIADPMTGVVLPRPPVIEVSSVWVVDSAGATLIPVDGWTTHDADDGLTHVLITPAFRAPTIAPGPAFLRVLYRAGYGPSGADVDPGIRHAMLMAVMRLYAGRGDPSMTLQSDPMMGELFAPFRVWTIA